MNNTLKLVAFWTGCGAIGVLTYRAATNLVFALYNLIYGRD